MLLAIERLPAYPARARPAQGRFRLSQGCPDAPPFDAICNVPAGSRK